MEDFIKLAQFAVAFSVYYVWIFRFHNVLKEFKSFGLSDLTRNLVGASKITLSTEKGGSIVTVTDDTGDSSALTAKKAYTYTKADCTRDIKAHLSAITNDILYPKDYIREYTNDITMYVPGIYKTPYAARYYANAVRGSQEEDFFSYLVRCEDNFSYRSMTLCRSSLAILSIPTLG